MPLPVSLVVAGNGMYVRPRNLRPARLVFHDMSPLACRGSAVAPDVPAPADAVLNAATRTGRGKTICPCTPRYDALLFSIVMRTAPIAESSVWAKSASVDAGVPTDTTL